MYRQDDEFQHADRPYRKLDDKIKELNSTRVFKKVTPKGDLSWYIKWIASFMLMIAVCFRAADVNHMFDLYFSLAGTVGWLIVGFLWHDRALIFLNAILSTVLLTGIIKELLACSNCMIPL
jgi:hypothetical protein